MSSVKSFFTILLFSILLVGCAVTPAPVNKAEVANFQDELTKYSKYEPYHNAIAQNSLEKLQDVLKSTPIDINSKIHPRGSLLYIASRGIQEKPDGIVRKEIIKYLIEEKHADINTKSDGGWTPLNAASDSGLLDIVKYLIEKGADIELKNIDGVTPLYVSAFRGHLNVVTYLVEKGAHIESKNNTGWSPLNVAAANNNLEVVKYLVKKGADIESKTNESVKPLYASSTNGHLDIVKYLVEKGADIESKVQGWSLLNAAVSKNKLDIVKYLVENGANPFKLPGMPNYVPNNNIAAILQYAQQNHATLKASAEQRILANMQKEKVAEYILKEDFVGLKAYTDENQNAVYYIPQIELRLMLTGPKGMKIGDIIKMVKKGRSEKIVLAMVRGVKSPYKEFTIDEIDLLVKMGLSDNIIAEIIDTTTDILKDKQKKAEQDKFLFEQAKIVKEGAATKVIYQNAPQNQGDDIIDIIGKEAAKQGVKMLLDNLF